MRYFNICMVYDLDVYFFFNDPATTEIYTLSLHDALPIFVLAFAPRTVAYNVCAVLLNLLMIVFLCDAGNQASGNVTVKMKRAVLKGFKLLIEFQFVYILVHRHAAESVIRLFFEFPRLTLYLAHC